MSDAGVLKRLIEERKQKDRHEEQIRRSGGDVEANKDLDYLLKHRDDNIGSLAELRTQRRDNDRHLQEQIQAEKERLEEERNEARIRSLESWIAENINDHIFITIEGKRLKKFKSWESLACAHCGSMLYPARGMALGIAEVHQAGLIDAKAPRFMLDSIECPKCRGANAVLVQGVY